MPHRKIPFISKKCLKHSNIGDFKYKNRKPRKMTGGGHGQDNIKYLASKNIEYSVLVEYNNGVRRGNISIHKTRKKRIGDAQAWFPKSWSEKDIKSAGQHIMKLKRNQKRENQKPYIGTYKGVKVGAYTVSGRISTIYPWYIQKGGTKYDLRWILQNIHTT